ncbi:MAG: hypothetical protein LBQ66_14320 [Planctomycetaceae bacterium]|jgi:hypothetical protein|nr:hypothetical protein [Planctomycetaceae bacterium]
MRKILSFVSLISVLVSVLFLSFGCSSSSRPADLPKLYPCKITITQDNSPLEGADVSLVPLEQSDGKWRSSAVTNESGIATMMTYGFKGSPAGKFKVVVTKNTNEDPEYSTDETGKKEIIGYASVYSTIEEQYTNPETTPHSIEISETNKNTSANFDVGKATKYKL